MDTKKEVSRLTVSDGQKYDHFGYAVAVSGYYAIASALNNDDFGESTGSAYLINRLHPIAIQSSPEDQLNVCVGSEVQFSYQALYAKITNGI